MVCTALSIHSNRSFLPKQRPIAQEDGAADHAFVLRTDVDGDDVILTHVV